VDTFTIGERVVRVASEHIDTRWMEPSAGDLHKMELAALGFLLLPLVLVGSVGALVLWYRGRGRSALTCGVLSLVGAGIASGALWAAAPTPRPRQFVVDGEPPITLGWSQEASRRPFELQSTQYTVSWWARLPPNEPSCHARVSFQRATADRDLDTLIDITLDRQRSRVGPAIERIYGVEPGRHELTIREDTGCEWSVTLTPGWSSPTPSPVR